MGAGDWRRGGLIKKVTFKQSPGEEGMHQRKRAGDRASAEEGTASAKASSTAGLGDGGRDQSSRHSIQSPGSSPTLTCGFLLAGT